MLAINVGNYGVVFDHESRLGPNYWPLFNAEMQKKKHQNKQVFMQNIFTEYFNILNFKLQNRYQKRPLLYIAAKKNDAGVVFDPKACLDPYYWPLVNPTMLKKHSNKRY